MNQSGDSVSKMADDTVSAAEKYSESIATIIRYSRHLPQRRKFFCYRGEMEKLCDRLHRKVFCANMSADYLVLLSAESDQNNERYGVYAR